MKSFEPTYLASLQIPHHVVGMVRRLGEFKGRQELHREQAPEVLENLRRVAVIQSTESSNRIEGIVADHARIRAMIEENVAPANRTEGEIAGYRDVLNTIHQSHSGIAFTTNVILQLQIAECVRYMTDTERRLLPRPGNLYSCHPFTCLTSSASTRFSMAMVAWRVF